MLGKQLYRICGDEWRSVSHRIIEVKVFTGSVWNATIVCDG
jgi:hypothetical protein